MNTQYTSCSAALLRFLPASVWKQAHQLHQPTKAPGRWDLHPLLVVLLLMTWTTGDSEAERFVTARAVYVSRHQHGKRPGRTLSGFQQALARALPRYVAHGYNMNRVGCRPGGDL